MRPLFCTCTTLNSVAPAKWQFSKCAGTAFQFSTTLTTTPQPLEIITGYRRTNAMVCVGNAGFTVEVYGELRAANASRGITHKRELYELMKRIRVLNLILLRCRSKSMQEPKLQQQKLIIYPLLS